MKTLFKNGTVVNVFTDTLDRADVLVEDGRIVGLGDYSDVTDAEVVDVTGRYICPGFIDGHIHIESTMLMPSELAKVCVPHGTTAIVADPHEIANVCGTKGISYMLHASENLPMQVFVMLPSCVPATGFDESGAELKAKDLLPLYGLERVLGLAEMMNYPGVLGADEDVMEKIHDARELGFVVNGHAPLLSGHDLDRYIAAGVSDDHECSSFEEACERVHKGQWVMIRQGTSARNLEGLIGMFDEPWNRRCMLVTDDKHPFDLLENGHIDSIIRQAVSMGKSPVVAIRMASLQAATHFGLSDMGAVAPGYQANLLVLDDLDQLQISEVYYQGQKVAENGQALDVKPAKIGSSLDSAVRNTFKISELSANDFFVEPVGPKAKTRVIRLIPGQLLTDEAVEELEFTKTNGIDTSRDILKLAVCERHQGTGHKGIGYIQGAGLKKGAIASSVSHDSHNLIVIGADEADMALAANRIREIGGGNVVVAGGKVLAEMPLPVAGLMSDSPAAEVASQNEKVRQAVHELGAPENIEPFMNMAFVSLTVIPHLKMTTLGLCNVDKQELVSLFV